MVPLKLYSVNYDVDITTVFPRLKKRGSIEACLLRRPRPKRSGFPRLKKRGSIEARKTLIYSVPLKIFPRLKKRGSIEAR